MSNYLVGTLKVSLSFVVVVVKGQFEVCVFDRIRY